MLDPAGQRQSPWGSSPVSTPFLCPSAECSVTGDIHFTTFDGRRYTFPATCQYILAKSRSSGTFTVTLQNAPCGLVSKGWGPQAQSSQPPLLSAPREAAGFRAGLQVFHSPLTVMSSLSGQSQGAGDSVLSLEHLIAESHFPFLGFSVF